MNRFLLHTLLGFLLATCQAGWVIAAQRPNIVVFILDDVGQQDVGAFGNNVVSTPNIDRLASEGMRFDRAFLSTSSCSSSRASLLTGLYPHSTGAPALNDPLPATVDSLPQQLKAAGYYTASVGKWHLGEPFKSHFDRVMENSGERAATDWLPELARRPHDKPFFFWFATSDAHAPYNWHTPLQLADPRSVIVSPRMEDTAYERRMTALYYFEIARVDRNIGAVLDALAQAGELDNTLVVVLSDNGSQFGGAKTTLYDDGLLTPLVMRYPARIAGQRENRQLVSAIDLAPTLLQLAGIAVPTAMQGVSLWPTIDNPQQAVRTSLYAERNRHGQPHFERAIRTETRLYKRNYLGRRLCDPEADNLDGIQNRDSGHEELYDMANDPAALTNLYRNPEYRSELASLRVQMNHIMHDTGDRAPPLLLLQCDTRPLHDRIHLPALTPPPSS